MQKFKKKDLKRKAEEKKIRACRDRDTTAQ